MSESSIRQAFVLAVALAAAGCGGVAEPRQAGGSPLGDGSEGSGEQTSGGTSTASTPLGPAHAQGSDRAATQVGPAGGTFELTNGVRLEIPAGAIARPIEVVLQRAPATEAFNNREDERTAGPAFIVSPHLVSANGSKFTVSVPMTSVPDGFQQSDVAVAYETVSAEQRGLSEQLGSTQTRWEHSNAAVRSGRMVAELDEMAGYRLQFVFSR